MVVVVIIIIIIHLEPHERAQPQLHKPFVLKYGDLSI